MANNEIVFLATNSSGTPLTGLTPTWDAAYDARDGSVVASPPAVTELGGGLYKFTVTGSDDLTGVIDIGASAEPRYLVLSGLLFQTFAAWDSSGSPLSGLTPTWESLVEFDTGTAYTPQMTLSAFGSGIYKVADPGTDTHLVGVIDMGASAQPRYASYDSDVAVLTLPSSSTLSTSLLGKTNKDLRVPKGEDMTITHTQYDQDASLYDFTGATVVFSVRPEPGSGTLTFSKSSAVPGEVDIVTPTSGVAVVNIDAADLATADSLWYDIWVQDAAGKWHILVPPSRFVIYERVR